MRATPEIIVIGAGIAGLAAALRLRERGCRATLLERSDRVGGRATSELREGFRLDSGAHQVSATDRNLLGLIAAAGLEEQLLPLRPFALAQVGGGESHVIDPSGVRGVAGMPGVLPHQALRLWRLPRILRRFREILDPERPEAAARLDDRSISDFTRLYFGRSVLDRWVAPFSADPSLCDPEETSRVLFLLQYVARRYAPVGTLRSALADLSQGLAARSETRLGFDVRAVEPARERLAIRVAEGGREWSVEADAVVLATPAPAAEEIASPLLQTAERDFLNRVRYAAAIVTAVALDRVLVGRATRIRVPAAEGWPAATIAIEPGGPGSPAPEDKELALVTASAAWSRAHLEAPDEIAEKDLVGLLQRLHPGVSSAVCLTRVWRHSHALPCFDVGCYREIARFRRVQRDLRNRGRRLYFAGDYLVHPSLEGAVTSGFRAADQIMRDLGATSRSGDVVEN